MSAPPVFTLTRGDGPLVVSFPHSGTHVPREIAARMTEAGRVLPDTDWHVPRLYTFLEELGATRIEATHSRYVIDLNRPPDGGALYPGQKNTGLVPRETFAGEAIYAGAPPDAGETASHAQRYYRPYHEALSGELARIQARHGFALLWDAHSIRSAVPSLFEGRLPDLNIGTNDGKSAPQEVSGPILAAAQSGSFSAVRDARFRGGHITRHYGRPQERVLAVQLEIAQAIYMDEDPPFPFAAARAERVSATIRAMIDAYLDAGVAFMRRA